MSERERQTEDALRAALCERDDACLCGCANDDHGEDGESCGVDWHSCIRVRKAVAERFANLKSALDVEQQAGRDVMALVLSHEGHIAKLESALAQVTRERDELLARNAGHPTMCCGQCAEKIAAAEAECARLRVELADVDIQRKTALLQGDDWRQKAEERAAHLDALRAELQRVKASEATLRLKDDGPQRIGDLESIVDGLLAEMYDTRAMLQTATDAEAIARGELRQAKARPTLRNEAYHRRAAVALDVIDAELVGQPDPPKRRRG